MKRAWFIGAGPGDPELLTLRGRRLLEGCGTVFVPPPFEALFAEFLQGKRLLIPFSFRFDELVQEIETAIKVADVGFLIPGDLTFYSPFQALIDRLGELAEVVPGVGTANAASAFLRKTFDLPGVCNRAIIASPRTLGDGEMSVSLEQLAAPGVTLLIYMNNLPLPELVSQLRRGYGGNVPIALLHRLCLPGQIVVRGHLDDIVAKVGDRDLFNLDTKEKRPALTLVVVGETIDASVDGSWWDYRHDHIWKEFYASNQPD